MGHLFGDASACRLLTVCPCKMHAVSLAAAIGWRQSQANTFASKTLPQGNMPGLRSRDVQALLRSRYTYVGRSPPTATTRYSRNTTELLNGRVLPLGRGPMISRLSIDGGCRQ